MRANARAFLKEEITMSSVVHTAEFSNAASKMKEGAVEMKQAAVEQGKHLVEQGQESLEKACKQTETAIKANPYRSVAIAFGVGALLGAFMFRR
jgi:ElaB/YqjD/DUF883 family membrane-anchored ribosome-binding protein